MFFIANETVVAKFCARTTTAPKIFKTHKEAFSWIQLRVSENYSGYKNLSCTNAQGNPGADMSWQSEFENCHGDRVVLSFSPVDF